MQRMITFGQPLGSAYNICHRYRAGHLRRAETDRPVPLLLRITGSDLCLMTGAPLSAILGPGKGACSNESFISTRRSQAIHLYPFGSLGLGGQHGPTQRRPFQPGNGDGHDRSPLLRGEPPSGHGGAARDPPAGECSREVTVEEGVPMDGGGWRRLSPSGTARAASRIPGKAAGPAPSPCRRGRLASRGARPILPTGRPTTER